jgi:hypothetical protein
MLIAAAFGLYFALHYALPLCTLYRTLPLIIDLHALVPILQPVIESTQPNKSL